MDGQALWQLGDEELLAALVDGEAALRRAYGHQLELVGELVARDLARSQGYRSSVHLLRDLVRVSRAEAERRVVHAEAVTAVCAVAGPELPPPLPAVAGAVRTGEIGAEHLEVIRRTVKDLPSHLAPADREVVEQTLVEAARSLDSVAVGRLGRTLVARLDQDGRPPDDDMSPQPAGNELRWVTRRDGGLVFKGRLGAEGAALLTSVLSPLAKPQPAADGVPDPRSGAERQGDALVQALRLAANSTDLPSEGGERPTVVVTMPLETLQEQLGAALLGDTALIPPWMARRLACDCGVIPTVLGSASEPLDLGRKTRTVSTALRRALVLRDRGCAFPGCTITARWCDGHHVRHWADGGSTSLENLVLLCGTHHDLIHHSAWTIQISGDGLPEFIPPRYIDPHQRPRRNPIHPTVPTPTADP
jgi:Domain of unknown function (DUF222)/HNH endonuclease